MKRILAIFVAILTALTVFSGCSGTPKHNCSKDGHVFIRYVSDNNATCLADGTETAKCEHCDETDTKSVLGTRLSTCVYVNGECKWCGAIEPIPHVCAYNMDSYAIVDGEVFHQSKCMCGEKTGEPTLEEGFIIANVDNAQSVLDGLTENQKVIFSDGEYTTELKIGMVNGEGERFLTNITLVATDSAKIRKISAVSDDNFVAYIDGLTFNNITLIGGDFDGIYLKGWSGYYGDYKNITVKGCYFTDTYTQLRIDNPSMGGEISGDYAVENLTIENCVFKGITASLASSVAINGVENLTVKNNIFDTIDYDVLQINHRLGGTVVITGNEFKNFGSRLFNFNAYIGNENYEVTIDISGNYIHEAYANRSAKYGKCPHTSDPLVLGANYWKVIPDSADDGLFNNITFNKSEQKRF